MLKACLDFGLTEEWFWNSTPLEIERAVESKQRIIEKERQEKAVYLYRLADLVGFSFGRLYGGKMPNIEEAFPNTFDAEELAEARQAQVMAESEARFLQWANSLNAFMKEEGG